MMNRLLSLSTLFFMTTSLYSQGVLISPLNSRAVVEKNIPDVISLGITDTLSLPFFEDFSQNKNGQPNDALWVDRDVWVSNSFTNAPVNAYVAVFDHLTPQGKPYGTINQGSSIHADSLTSQPIDLSSYNESDDIILSYFWGAGGLGDAPEIEDSLKLYFKNDTGAWIQRWAVGGSNANQSMTFASERINDGTFFHGAFQFMFVNYTKETGNLNHFFVDYISVAENRLKDTTYKGFKDIGAVNSSGSLLSEYSQMPYSHFLLSPGSNMKGDHCVRIRSLHDNQVVQTRFGVNYYNQYGTKVAFVPDATNAKNINADSFAQFCFPTPELDTLSGDNPFLRVEYVINPLGGTEYPVDNNAQSNNNLFSYTQQFNPWYAYDDGSAEGGIGLDYTNLPTNHKGQFAVKFNTKKPDSIKGVAIYFNRSKEDVSFRSFKLKLWDELSAVGLPDNSDKVLYSQEVFKPAYTDSINGFAYIMFDSAIALPIGDFYIGWEQSQKFLLNVGYDNNYRFESQERFNPNVFFNLLNSWKKGFNIYGTPMMRPIIGQDKDFYFGTESLALSKVQLYPNPASTTITFKNLPEKSSIHILSVDGRVLKQSNSSTIDIRNLNKGMYFAQIYHESNLKIVRFIKY